MKKRVLILVLFVSLVGIWSCSGGGGGGGVTTEQGTTPLQDIDDSTVTGTYNVTSFDFYYTSGEHFSSSDLDSFTGQITIDFAADETTYELEWQDREYGDYYDYGESRLSEPDPDAEWDAAYYEITGDYTMTFFYENFCVDGSCADVVIDIQKTTDSVLPSYIPHP